MCLTVLFSCDVCSSRCVLLLHVLTRTLGSLCAWESPFSVQCCYLGFITSCPNLFVLFCFLLVSPPSNPPSSPLSYCLPLPYRLCVCHICYQVNGTECNQNHASLSDHGGTVPLSTYFSYTPSSLVHHAAPLCWKHELRRDSTRLSIPREEHGSLSPPVGR